MSHIEDLKQFKKNKRKQFLLKYNPYYKIKNEILLYKRAKKSPDPVKSSISETVAFVIDDVVQDIIYCQPKMAAILLSNPKIVKVNPGQMIQRGWILIEDEFYDPNKYFNTYPHRKNENNK